MKSFVKLIILLYFVKLISGKCCPASQIYQRDKDSDRTFCELATNAGFSCEEHEITTEDGYILAAYRITDAKAKAKKKPVLFVHGFLGDSTNYIINSPGDGTADSDCKKGDKVVSSNIGYAAATFGYDCWFLQCRGNYGSQRHTKLSSNSKEFWKFSAEEITKFDLPATIEYILKKSDAKSIGYVGHSQGTLAVLQLLASKTEYNNKIDKIILMAPVASTCHTTSIFSAFMLPTIPDILREIGGPFPDLFSPIAPLTNICPLEKILSPTLITPLFGKPGASDESRTHVYLSHIGVSSIWCLVKLVQNPCTCISHFDYGKHENIKRYNRETPPIYDLSKITTKVALIIGGNDATTQPKDVDCIRRQVKNIVYDKIFPGKNHLNVLIGKGVCRISEIVLEQLDDYK